MNCPTCGAPPEPKSGNWDDFTRIWRNASKALLLMRDTVERFKSDAKYHEGQHQLLVQKSKTAGGVNDCGKCRNYALYVSELQTRLKESEIKVKDLEGTVLELGQQLIEAMAEREGK
jgi:hypothetical protein